MEWFRTHFYVSLIALAAIIILAGAFLVKERLQVAPNSSGTVAWGGFNSLLYPVEPNGAIGDAGPELPNIYQDIQSGPPFWYPTSGIGDSSENTGTFDVEAFIAMLKQENPSGPTGSASGGDALFADAYSFIPSGLIATSAPAKVLTDSQQALYTYGNEAGSYIEVFQERNRDMARVLKDEFEDPTDPLKRTALIDLANGLVGVGENLAQIETIPEQARSANARLAKGYESIGEKLALIPDAHTDEERINAMLTYNSAVEEYIKSYVALITVFSIAEVSFRADEPGSVFMFSGGSL